MRARSADMVQTGAGFPRIPAVEKLLGSEGGRALLADYSRASVLEALRAVLERARATMRERGELLEDTLVPQAVCAEARRVLEEKSRRRARPVVNATGIVLHTNLGRALLAPSAADAAYVAATRPLALEVDVERGRRGDRDELVETHLCALTGAEAGTVVNNNAAAVLLTLNTLAEGREVIVSRGELIEIGGSFRIPEILRKSGAILREVGTTNRTHPADYENAIGAATGLLLKVHTSNYRIVGFTTSVDVAELALLASRHGSLPVVEDLGAGALVDLTEYGLAAEPVVADRLRAGADVVTFSGDKLLGGPQCGIVVGRRSLIEAIRRNPLKRALRCNKSTLAALEETLRIYRFDPAPQRTLPVLAHLTRPIEELEALGREAAELLGTRLGDAVSVALHASEAQVGSGSQPQVAIESRALALTSVSESADELAARFRASDPPILGRIERGILYLDLRAVDRASDLVPAAVQPDSARAAT